MLSFATFKLDFWPHNSSSNPSIFCYWVCNTSCSFIISCSSFSLDLNSICISRSAMYWVWAFSTEVWVLEKLENVWLYQCKKPNYSQSSMILRFSLKLSFHALPKDIYLLRTLIQESYFHDLGIKYIWLSRLLSILLKTIIIQCFGNFSPVMVDLHKLQIFFL